MASAEMKRRNYQAYMLRLWQDQVETGAIWRASLESPHTGERLGFASLEALCDFLIQRAAQSAQAQTVSEKRER